jgi:hypothetical protein
VAVLLLLGLVQFVYWRLLVYRPDAVPVAPGGGAGPGPSIVSVGGREDITVDTYAGEGPGYRDGGLWEARFCGPNALALGPGGALYVADSRNHRIRKIARDGQVTTVAGVGEPDGSGGRADGAALGAARFRFPSGVAVDPDGVIYVADTGNHRICRIEAGQVTTAAGGVQGKADGPGADARFNAPAALALDGDRLWIADLGNQTVRTLDASGRVSTAASVPPTISAILGQVTPQAAPTVVNASEGGLGLPAPTQFTLGRRSPGARLSTGAAVYADTIHGVLMVNEAASGALLAAGKRVASPTPTRGVINGSGEQASFALPCAAVLGADGRVYVADYEANVIRQVSLPEWLQQGAAVPEGPRRGRRRMRSER